MTNPRKKVPPRSIYLAVWECGAFRACRSAASAKSEIEEHSDTCCAVGGHVGRVVAYRRGSLFGTGRDAWRRASRRGLVEGGQ